MSDFKLAIEECGDRTGGRALTGFGRPFGLGIDRAGSLYVTDMDVHAVFRIGADLGGWSVLDGTGAPWTEPRPFAGGAAARSWPRRASCFDGPHSVDFDESGDTYVTTYYTPAVHVLDAQGARLRSIGEAGSRRPLGGPATAFFDHRQRLLVAEYRHCAVYAFDCTGRYLGALGGPGDFDRPHMCRQHPDGHLVVADTWHHRLLRFAPDGSAAGWIGGGPDGPTEGWSRAVGPALAGSGAGSLHAPVSVDVDAGADMMVVADWGNDRLVLFNAQGRRPRPLYAGRLSKPYDARFWRDRLVVADSHHGRVLVLPHPAAAGEKDA